MNIFAAYRVDMQRRGITHRSFQTYDRVVALYTAWLRENDVRVEDAKRAHVELFLHSTGWAPTTQHTNLAYLSAAYSYAIDALELLTRNPCRRVTLPRAPEKVKPTVPNARIREILRDVRDEDDDLFIRLFVFTGMRTIEVRRLTWDKVSLEENTLLAIGKGNRERLVPIHPELRKRLLGRAWAHGHAHVAAGRPGDKVSANGVYYRMERICGRGVHNHDFRRTVATSLRANGVDPYVRDAIMGWTRDSIFDRYYNQVSPAELQAGILRLFADDPV